MKRAVISLTITGECEVDIEKVKKYWHNNCTIYRCKFNGEIQYMLVETSPKGRVQRLKINISEDTAQTLIKMLNLNGVRDEIFNNCVTYRNWD